MTDFGDQGTATSPIDICMREEHVSFGEAVVLLAARYNVSDELKHSVNKPDIRKRPASADEAEGSRFFELEEAFTPEQLAILGPRVKQEHCDALHWHVAKSISYVKNREVTTKYTTPTYPILMRQCVIPGADGKPESEKSFYKIYEPLNPDKQWRFSYTPDGVKPRYYTNGLYELKAAWAKWNASQETQFLMIQPMRASLTYRRNSKRRSSAQVSVMRCVSGRWGIIPCGSIVRHKRSRLMKLKRS